MKHQKVAYDDYDDGETYTNLTLLVWGDAAIIRKEVEANTQEDVWADVLEDVPVDLIDAEKTIRECLAMGSLQVLADYDRRIMSRVSSMSCKVLLLGKAMNNECCEERIGVASGIIRTDDEELPLVVRKIKSVFRSDLELAAGTGLLPLPLFVIMRIIAQRWRGDVQAIEGINNIIKSITTLCPGIEMNLLDARVASRKKLGLGSRAARVTR